MFKVDAIKVKIDPANGHPTAVAFATVEIPNLIKVARIKIKRGDTGYYCLAPSENYIENGMKKWANVVMFNKPIWDKLQEKIIEEYKKQCSEERSPVSERRGRKLKMVYREEGENDAEE